MSDYFIGIDLGTSNSAVAFIDRSKGPGAPVVDFPIVQAIRPADVRGQALLPSALYLQHPDELPVEAYALPWDPEPPQIAGEFARWQGSRVPSRLITSAKSWLSHGGVDRMAPILPWGAPPDVTKMSPVEASSRLLAHIRDAWNHVHPGALIENLEVVITVPASFDEVARSLTVSAARRAGFEKFTLVEEPQAAFYDFTGRHRHDLAAALEGVSLVLVVDVGGGTCDFTLVKVESDERLRRIAVGDHLMLGGDNMDAAVARRAEEQMTAGGRKLSPGQWTELVQAARIAKESLLSENPPESCRLSVLAEGGRLIGGSMSAKISREDVERIVLDGFYPQCAPTDLPRRSTTRVALQEFGLPYASDPAITRQLAAFLHAHAAAGQPDAILLNGGVFNSHAIASRLVQVVSGWWPGASRLRLLEHESLELAVARGAAWYGMVRHGLGTRIGGGAAHSFYIGLEKKRTRDDGGEGEQKALCLIPRGQEEGQAVELGARTFSLTLGTPVQFPLFTSTSDSMVSSGDIVTVTDDLHPLPPIHTVLKNAEGKTGHMPVHLRAILTEIGTLELWCVSGASQERWRLEFELRGAAGPQKDTIIEPMPPHFAEARQQIEETFAAKPAGGATSSAPVKVRQLWRGLERVLGPREHWRVPVLREMWGALHARAGKRRRSPDHERVWFQLAGYTLRPGFGYPLDDWRCEQMVESLFGSGVAYHKEKAVWNEFWIMWRRIAGGLSEERHADIWKFLKAELETRLTQDPRKHQAKRKGIQPEGLDEMVRLAAALEHLDPAEKVTLGGWIVPRIAAAGPWTWALGRIGARVPLYGSVHKTVDPDHASEWLNVLLDAHERKVEGALFAIVQIARLTGDRSRDVDNAIRNRAIDAVRQAHAPESWQRLLLEVVTMEIADQSRAFGDTLPAGLAA